MARKRKRPDSPSRFREEAIGFVCLAAAVFLMVALASYNAADPNPFDLSASAPVRNWAGPVGATLAALAFQLVGLGAWLCALVLGLAGWNRIRRRKIESPFTKALGIATLTASTCGLATMGIGAITYGGGEFAAGGVIGTLTSLALLSAFGPVGGPLVAATAALLAVIAATRLSIEAMVLAAWRGLINSVRRARTSFAHWREQRRKAKARRSVIDKHARASAAKKVEAPEEPIAVDEPASRPLLKVKVPVTVTRPDAELPEIMVVKKESPEATSPPPIQRKAPSPPPRKPDPLPFEQPAGPDGSYALPDVDLLDLADADEEIEESEFVEKAKAIASKGAEFKVTGEVVAIHPGPVVTTYEFRPSAGVKYSRILNLEEDLSLALRAESIRIARLPGKSTVGIEAPNSNRRVIRLREILESKQFLKSRSKLSLAIGKEIHGENVVADLARAPHLLIAGTTGSGKSVALNAMLLSLLYKATPDEVKLVLVDPKRLEFGLYEDIPHLLTPVVVDADRAANALGWAVREMEKRYRRLAEFGVRNIEQFNMMLLRGEEEMLAKMKKSGDTLGVRFDPADLKPLPYLVVIIDELADLMMCASAAVEACIMRLAQMARAVGIHLILATQRPSVDVITGTIKNNLPARISFRVASKTDSRVVLDAHGAENLLGKGDMLFLAPGTSRLQRVHGAYVDEDEVRAVVDFWRNQARPQFEQEVTLPPPEGESKGADEEPGDRDEYFEEALRLVVGAGEASISNIQRKLRLGYARAGRIVDMMEAEGLVGPPEGSKPRRLLVDASYLAQKYGADAVVPPQ